MPRSSQKRRTFEHRLLHLGVVVVEVRLVMEEAVPVVLAAHRVPRPVRRLGVDEDDARLAVALVACPTRRTSRPSGRSGSVRDSWNHGWSDEVWFMTRSAITRIPRWCACSTNSLEVLDRPVVGMDREEVGDVVAAVAQRRLVHRQQPDAVDAEPLQVVELLDQPAEVAGAVVVAVEEAADVDLVEDRALEPQRVALEPVARRQRHAADPAARGRLPGCEANVVAPDVPRRSVVAVEQVAHADTPAAGRSRPGGCRRLPACAHGSRLTTTITRCRPCA